MHLNLIQYVDESGKRRVGVVRGRDAFPVRNAESTAELAWHAIEAGLGLAEVVRSQGLEDSGLPLDALVEQGNLLPPLDHQDPAHCLVTGTGLTHLGSASARDRMHHQLQEAETLTDSMRMFRWGLEGGKPPSGQVGAQPEWFYKGDGSIVTRPGAAFEVPAFSEDFGEEPELVGLYLIGPDRRPYRVGYALGNEMSDHVMEKRNYLYLAHSKLRPCSYGPELRTGPMPTHVAGHSRIVRQGKVVWEKGFLSGQDNMCHSFENLEHHHFKYAQFLRPGDVHVHFFGTATLSFADGVRAQLGDEFEIEASLFGLPLRNSVRMAAAPQAPGFVASL